MALVMLAAPAQAQRDAWLAPFTSTSIWNHPIGAEAAYVSANLGPAYGAGTDVVHLLRTDARDPLQQVYQQANGFNGPRCEGDVPIDGLAFHLPDDYLVADTYQSDYGRTPNSAYAFLLPDGETVFGGQRVARCEPGGRVYLPDFMRFPNNVERAKAAVYGDGLDGGGHGATQLSSLGGTIRVGELTGDAPIRHAVKLMIWAERYLYYDPADPTPGYRWPAKSADIYAEEEYGGTNPSLVMGSLLAIPPGETEGTLGLESQPGRRLFYALQNYGAYITEDPRWNSHAITISEAAYLEFEAVFGYSLSDRETPWARDLNRLVQALHVVDNNAPDRIGGGGEPRVPLAPDFAEATAPVGETVCLVAEVNGRYVVAEEAGAAPLVADRAWCRGWERFEVLDVGGGAVALRAEVNGQYVAVQEDGTLLAAAPTADARTRFVWDERGGAVCLLNAYERAYVAAEAAGAEPLVADRAACDRWERFRVEPAGASVAGEAEAGRAAGVPEVVALEAIHPNPLAQAGTVRYALPEDAEVTLEVFDALGRRVAVLEHGPRVAGYHTASFDARALAAGVYLVRFQAGSSLHTASVTVLR